MRNLSWLLLALLVLAPAAHAAQPRCPLALVADLDVELGNGGAVAIPARVNDRDVRVFLDLHSGMSAVFSDALEVAGVESKTLMHKAFTGSRVSSEERGIRSRDNKTMSRFVAFDSVILGNVAFGRFEALAIEAQMPRVREGTQPIVGLIGSNAFQNLDVELNLPERKLRLFKATECKDPPVYWDAVVTSVPSSYDKAGTLSFTMELDGQKIMTSFDTTQPGSSLDARATARYFGFAPDAPELERSTGPNGQVANFRAMTLAAEGLNVRNARIRLDAQKAAHCKLGRRDVGIGYDNCVNTVPLVIGTDLLKQLRVLVASKQNRIYFSAPAAVSP